MSYLLVDAGNSYLKWSMTSEDGELVDIQRAPMDSWSSIETWQNKIQPESIWISCVASQQVREQLVTALQNKWSLMPNIITSPAQGMGLSNSYQEPSLLGSDRWAAMVAAYNLEKSAVLVVDAGTALTIDAVDDHGQHLGGMILPGLARSRQALVENTSIGLDELDSEFEDVEIFGTSTRQAISSGTHFAMISLIEYTLHQLDNQLLTAKAMSRSRCYLTGGDAVRIKDTLQCLYVYEPDLVLKGLALIAAAA